MTQPNDPRQDLIELLPFWANGTLSPDETARVESAIATDADIRQEAEFLRALRGQMQDTPDEGFSPGEMGLARLMRDIDNEQAAPAKQSGNVIAMPLRWAAMAATVAFAFYAGTTMTGAEDTYIQASGEDPSFGLSVMFHPQAAVSEITATLREQGLVIVDGPSAIGLYHLASVSDDPLAPIVESLEAQDTLFEMVDYYE